MLKKIFSVAFFLSIFPTPAFAHVEFGEEYDSCMATADNNLAMTECLSQESERLEKQVEEAYTAAMTRAMDQDQTEKEITPDRPEFHNNAENLRKSQDAFKAYLETECNRRMLLFGLGSGAGAEHAGCLAVLRTQRLLDLKN